MADEFYTDFSEDEVGQLPDGWTVTAGHAPAWTVENKGDAVGGKALRIWSNQATSGQHFLRWDIPVLGDMLVEGRFMATFEHSANRIRLFGRMGDNETGYFTELTGHTNRYALWKVLNGAFNSLGENPIPWDVNTWYRQEIEIIGRRVRSRFWEDGGEKPDWIISQLDNDISEGRAGVSMRIPGETHYSWVDWIKVTEIPNPYNFSIVFNAINKNSLTTRESGFISILEELGVVTVISNSEVESFDYTGVDLLVIRQMTNLGSTVHPSINFIASLGLNTIVTELHDASVLLEMDLGNPQTLSGAGRFLLLHPITEPVGSGQTGVYNSNTSGSYTDSFPEGFYPYIGLDGTTNRSVAGTRDFITHRAVWHGMKAAHNYNVNGQEIFKNACLWALGEIPVMMPPENISVNLFEGSFIEDSIFTTDAAGNSQSGNTFILDTGDNNVYIDAVILSLQGGSDNVSVYYREGDPVYSRDGNWILHESRNFTGNGNEEVDQRFDFSSPLILNSNSRYSFFIVRESGSMNLNYTNGNQVIQGGGLTYTSDRGVNSPTFGDSFADRQWNGEIIYRYLQ